MVTGWAKKGPRPLLRNFYLPLSGFFRLVQVPNLGNFEFRHRGLVRNRRELKKMEFDRDDLEKMTNIQNA